MLELIAGFAAGMLTMFLSLHHAAARERAVRADLERRLSRERDALVDMKISNAFMAGCDCQRNANCMTETGLRRELEVLRQQNDTLRERLGSETIFAHTVAAKGGAVMHLQKRETI